MILDSGANVKVFIGKIDVFFEKIDV